GGRTLFAKKRCRFITKSGPCQSVKGFIETFSPIFCSWSQAEGHYVGAPQSAPNFPQPERLTRFQRVKRGRASRDAIPLAVAGGGAPPRPPPPPPPPPPPGENSHR